MQAVGPSLNSSPLTNHTSNSGDKKKSKRQKVDHACVYCRRSHMTCDSQRPCGRCIKRNIGHLCRDEPRPGKKTEKKKDKEMSTSQVLVDSNLLIPTASQPLNAVNTAAATEPDRSFFNDWSSLGNQSILSQTVAYNQNPVFYSEHAGSEFSSLNDFLTMIDDPTNNSALFGDALGINGPNNTTGGGSSDASTAAPFAAVTAGQPPSVTSSAIMPHISSGPGSSQLNSREASNENGRGSETASNDAKDNFFLTAADPSEDISPEERLKQVINAKLEAGLLQPFNYVKGYTRLQKYMDNYMNVSSKQRILKPLTIFRPAFRAVAQSLKDVDLVLVEEAFERMLLDYDRVFTSMAIPACLWRRTGEIYRGNKEFAGLVEVNVEDLRDGKLAIYELMSEESAVNYWEKYGNIAFDSGQKAVLTSCNLRTRDGRKRRACCFSFTIRRDRYNIPSCIIGNFIPIHP
ncbi:regulator of drug sensitivity 2 [Trichomonascus vanleenenianus]|uniref:gluconeogenesis transcription factor RDS2 n=1 Tax=Trichomonascus vanleenenianus TaxID=2268995 RepID=UPI003EC9648C